MQRPLIELSNGWQGGAGTHDVVRGGRATGSHGSINDIAGIDHPLTLIFTSGRFDGTRVTPPTSHCHLPVCHAAYR
jgi:hypothetical protein